MKVNVTDRQSMLDIALKTSGSMEAIFDIALLNDIAVTSTLNTEAPIEAAEIIDRNVANRYELNKISPATDIPEEKRHGGGIGSWMVGEFQIPQ